MPAFSCNEKAKPSPNEMAASGSHLCNFLYQPTVSGFVTRLGKQDYSS